MLPMPYIPVVATPEFCITQCLVSAPPPLLEIGSGNFNRLRNGKKLLHVGQGQVQLVIIDLPPLLELRLHKLHLQAIGW